MRRVDAGRLCDFFASSFAPPPRLTPLRLPPHPLDHAHQPLDLLPKSLPHAIRRFPDLRPALHNQLRVVRDALHRRNESLYRANRLLDLANVRVRLPEFAMLSYHERLRYGCSGSHVDIGGGVALIPD